ncbi:tellurite resistance TerB C-terminal domain-containing protein [Calothrix sp. 336/3]|nr:hypothetical protein IJ00_14595 [Calothrix sp. 336/3]
MQSVMVSNRFILGIVAFSISFGISFIFTWDLTKSILTALITVPATYFAVILVDRRRRNHEILVFESLSRRVRELEGLKLRMLSEIQQLETHHNLLYQESSNLQTQITERRHQRDSLNRELSTCIIERKQIESKLFHLQNEIKTLEETKTEINNSYTAINAEKRRLELTFNVSKAEVTQLQNQISELQQQKQGLESNITLLERLKPQLEEKLYELRLQIQGLETEEKKRNQVLIDKTSAKDSAEANLVSLEAQIIEQKQQLGLLQGQITLLQTERDQLQNQVWELLQQIDTVNHDASNQFDIANGEDDGELFPFTDLLDAIDLETKQPKQYTYTENIPQEWQIFSSQLEKYELEIIQAIYQQDNPYPTLKRIAEEHITMPNLLIDHINERANNTIGELIINPCSDIPQIYPEHQVNIQHILASYGEQLTQQTSSNSIANSP